MAGFCPEFYIIGYPIPWGICPQTDCKTVQCSIPVPDGHRQSPASEFDFSIILNLKLLPLPQESVMG